MCFDGPHQNTRIHQNTSKYIKIHQNTSKYIKIHQNTSKYIKIHQNTSKYIKIHQNTSKYIKIHQNTSKYIKIHQNTSKYIKIHQNTSKYIKIQKYTTIQLPTYTPPGRHENKVWGCGSGVRAIITRGWGGGQGITKLTLIYIKIHKWGFLLSPTTVYKGVNQSSSPSVDR